MPHYMHIPGVTGNVTTQGYQDWIAIDQLDFNGISNQISQEIGNDMDRVTHHPEFHAITIYKTLDRSSIALFEYAHHRKVIPEIEIHAVTTSDPVFTYAKLTINDAIVSHYSERSRDQQQLKPSEMIAFHYTRIQKAYIPRNADNTPDSPIISGYDLSQGVAL